MAQQTVNYMPGSGDSLPAGAAKINANFTELYGQIGNAITGLPNRPQVRLVAVAALPANTYSNGTSGVGATLTITATGTLTVDGKTVNLGDDIFVAGEASLANNGIFRCTTFGTGGVSAVLTRRATENTPAGLGFACALATDGTAYAGFGFRVATDPATITIGTTAITVAQSASPLGVAAEVTRATGVESVLTAAAATISNLISPLPKNHYGFTNSEVDAAGNIGKATTTLGAPVQVPSATETLVAATLSQLPKNPYGYASAEIDAAGNVGNALLLAGGVVSPPNPSLAALTAQNNQMALEILPTTRPIAYAASGVLHYVDAYGDHAVSSPAGSIYPEWRYNHLEFCTDYLSSGTLRKFRIALDGSGLTPEANGVLNHYLGGGQSLYAAIYSIPAVSIGSNPYPTQNLMFVSGITPYNRGVVAAITLPLTSLVTLAEAGAETLTTGLSREIQRRTFAATATYHTSLFSGWGVAGQPYSAMAKGTVPYANMLAEVTAARTLALAAGQLHLVRGVNMIHGEADNQNASYAANLTQWQSDIDTDVKAITGQTQAVQMFLCQLSAWNYAGATANLETHGLQSPWKQYLATVGAANLHLVGPKYFLTYPKTATAYSSGDSQGLHIDSLSERLLGAYHAKAVKRVIQDRLKWSPLQPIAFTRTGAVIDVQFNVPVGPLVLDNVAVTDPTSGNYGFEYFDTSGSPPAISAVALKAGTTDTVRITLASDPGSNANKTVRYAFTSVPNAGGGATLGPRGCLRDSDAESPDWDATVHLYNWCIHFDSLLFSFTL